MSPGHLLLTLPAQQSSSSPTLENGVGSPNRQTDFITSGYAYRLFVLRSRFCRISSKKAQQSWEKTNTKSLAMLKRPLLSGFSLWDGTLMK